VNLTAENYYSTKANRAYFSVSQFKDFRKCEAAALAKLNGEFQEDFGRALLLGRYVDEMLTGTEDSQRAFVADHEDDLFKKNGDPYADIEQAQSTIIRIRRQPLMMQHLNGSHQTIMTGKIEGVPFKIKMDSYKPGEFICDLKYMASLRSPNLFEPMVSYWGYDIQAAVYQEIVYQNTGVRLPFRFVVATKEKPAHLAVGEINQWNMDAAFEVVRKNIVRYADVKAGRIPPARCEEYDCDYCTSTVYLTEIIDTDLFGMSRKQVEL
jgi:hypothetical protein